MKDFLIKLEDKYTPSEYIENEVVDEIREATQGILYSEIKQYTGKIQSYDYKTGSGIYNVLGDFGGKTIHHNIQNDLGEIDRNEYTYEFYIKSSLIDSYKYRVMFFRFGDAGYPVTVVLSSVIAKSINDDNSSEYVYSIGNMEEFGAFIEDVINSDALHDILQEAIIASLRHKEKKDETPVIINEEK